MTAQYLAFCDRLEILIWSLAQDLSDVLPEGDKEKQMLQGLVGSKERVVSQVRQGRLPGIGAF